MEMVLDVTLQTFRPFLVIWDHYLLVQKENSYYVFVGETEECWLPKIVLSYDFGSQLYVGLGICVGPSSQKYDQISFLARSPYCDYNIHKTPKWWPEPIYGSIMLKYFVCYY